MTDAVAKGRARQNVPTSVGKAKPHSRDTAAVLRDHLADCLSVRAETNEKLDRLDDKLGKIEDRFKTFDRVVAFGVKYGRWMLGIALTAFVSAWVSIYVQTYNAGLNANKAAQAAVSAASTSTAATQQLSGKIDKALARSAPPP